MHEVESIIPRVRLVLEQPPRITDTHAEKLLREELAGRHPGEKTIKTRARHTRRER